MTSAQRTLRSAAPAGSVRARRSRRSEARHRRAREAAERANRRAYLALISVVAILNLFGLVMVLSASSVTALDRHGSPWYFFQRQAIWVTIGALVAFVASRVDYHRWVKHVGLTLVVTVFLLVAVLAVGKEVNGSRRWLGVGSLGIQPSEFAKLAVILFTAELLARRADRVDRTRLTLRPVIVVSALVIGLVVIENLGTALLIGGIVMGMLFVAGTPLRSLFSVMVPASAGAFALAMLVPYRRRRLMAFLDPWADPQDGGYQYIQSLVSLSSGGWWGRGLGASREKFGWLPYAHTDFIFAIVAEEVGIVGAFAVIGLFLMFGILGVRTAFHAPDPLGRMLAAGITIWIVFQAAVNMGAVLSLLPITGVPLPFVSFGGSSMVVTMFATGILVGIARRAQ